MDEQTKVVTDKNKAAALEQVAAVQSESLPDAKDKVTYLCPKCHRRMSGPKGRLHLCTCGATISTQ
jgi:hypothetical protein